MSAPYYIKVPELKNEGDTSEASPQCHGCAVHDPGRPYTMTDTCKQLRGDGVEANCAGHIFIRNTPEAKAEYVFTRLGIQNVSCT